MSSDLAVEQVPTDAVHLYPGNARRHDLPLLMESLTLHGQWRPAVVQRSTGYVLIGNGMTQAARELGWPSLSVHYRDVDDDTARRIVLLDNRTNDLGGYNDQALLALLNDLPSYDGTGYEEGDLAALRALLDSAVPDFPGSDQDAADAQERAAWPRVNVQVPRPLYARWRAVPGADDTARLTALLDAWDAAAG